MTPKIAESIGYEVGMMSPSFPASSKKASADFAILGERMSKFARYYVRGHMQAQEMASKTVAAMAGHSSQISIILLAGDQSIPVAQVGRRRLKLRDPIFRGPLRLATTVNGKMTTVGVALSKWIEIL